MLPKLLLSVAAAYGLCFSGVFAGKLRQAALATKNTQQLQQEAATDRAEQRQFTDSLKKFNNAYSADAAIAARFGESYIEPEDDENFVALKLWPETKYQPRGREVDIEWDSLRNNRCYDLPENTRVKSLSKSHGAFCCLLYRSPCPSEPRTEFHAQDPGFFHQKIFATSISDLSPYGFTEYPRSIICPAKDICDGFLKDRNWSPAEEINLAPWWVDYKYVPDRRHI
ncbi:hypothetical protein V8F20_012391 [Naviculisporaceae sp. PSN 640]